MLGSSIGLLGDTLLVHLADPMAWASEKIMELAEWFESLPDPIQKLTTYVLGLGAAFKILKTLGITSIFSSIAAGLLGLAGISTSGGIIAGLEAAMAAGGLRVRLPGLHRSWPDWWPDSPGSRSSAIPGPWTGSVRLGEGSRRNISGSRTS